MPNFLTRARRSFSPLLLLLLLGGGAGLFFSGRHESLPVRQAAGERNRPQPASLAVPSPAAITNAAAGADDTNGATDSAQAPALFAFAQLPDAAALDRALPAPARQIHYVALDRALIGGKRSPFWQPPGAGRIAVPLPDGSALAVTIDSSEMLGPDRFTSIGQIEGRPASRAVFAWHAGFLHASIDDPLLGSFVVRVATAEHAQFYRVDPALAGKCGGERRPTAEQIRSAPARAGGVDFAPPTPGTPALSPTPAIDAAPNAQRVEVHVLMLYTQAVLPTLSGTARAAALQSAFDQVVAKTNDRFAASLITARLRLVSVAETRHDENASQRGKVQDDALTAAYLENDGKMDELHALRDQTGADLVCLALNRSDTASSGLSFLLDDPDEAANARFAFSVVEYSQLAGTNLVAHELGHVFGCAHDRDNAQSGEGAFGFSYGYRFTGADGRTYHDIMAYAPGAELNYFSNPDVIVPAPVNAPIGIAAGRPGESNTALTIERTAFVTSTYRLQTRAAPSPGVLINVATRAFVGAGDEVLIGGFIVDGAGTKRLLVRAAGPALAAFDVRNPLPDPVLRVFSGDRMIAENDNWMTPLNTSPGASVPASGPEIALAALQAGAFPFPAGSADSALLLTLPSGTYTAVIEGAHGATGAGLVEAYEIEPGAAKLINLATRGYAARDDREMVGGFVVAGVTGETKRVLIRALGPTLGRAPFNMTGVLHDPEMEIRDANGELLIRSDDWSNGAEGGASPENDFRPLVELHGEKQIFATGLAPANRREPCVLVDLPPGSYTAIVRPYELRSSNPQLDQPPVPGVGIVEVYEIDR